MPNAIDLVAEVLAQRKAFERVAKDLCVTLRKAFRHYPWVGVYLLENGDTLVLKAWDGAQATEHGRIPVGQGICGLAAREKRTVIVDDVSKDPRYLQCFLSTRSEIVVPLFKNGKVVGEIDIDGDQVAAFNETDRIFLEWCAERLGKLVPGEGVRDARAPGAAP
jgi:GAF domain-containing protein